MGRICHIGKVIIHTYSHLQTCGICTTHKRNMHFSTWCYFPYILETTASICFLVTSENMPLHTLINRFRKLKQRTLPLTMPRFLCCLVLHSSDFCATGSTDISWRILDQDRSMSLFWGWFHGSEPIE